jgi:hypothetical protein
MSQPAATALRRIASESWSTSSALMAWKAWDRRHRDEARGRPRTRRTTRLRPDWRRRPAPKPFRGRTAWLGR